MEDFQQTLFQMVSLRMMGARILPSLLSLLPQTEIYRDDPAGRSWIFAPICSPSSCSPATRSVVAAGSSCPSAIASISI